jgi:hypothetical protein
MDRAGLKKNHSAAIGYRAGLLENHSTAIGYRAGFLENHGMAIGGSRRPLENSRQRPRYNQQRGGDGLRKRQIRIEHGASLKREASRRIMT